MSIMKSICFLLLLTAIALEATPLAGKADFHKILSRFVHLEIFSLNVSSLSFTIRVNLLHP